MKTIQIAFLLCMVSLADDLPDTLWTVYEDSPYLEYAVDGVLTQDGCYAFAGTNDSLLTLRIFSSSGSEVLSRLFQVPNAFLVYAHSIDQLNDAGFVIGGKTADDCGVYLRTDASGDTLWTALYPDIDQYSVMSVMASSDGGYILMYEIPGTPPYGVNIQLQKYDSGDGLEWQVVFDDYLLNNTRWITQEADGSLVIAGDAGDESIPSQFIFLTKLDSNGSEVWHRTYISEICPYIATNDCCRTSDGGYCIVGHSDFNSIMLKVDADGNEQWRREYQGSRALLSVSPIGYGNLVSGGFAGNFSSAFLFAVNSIGETLWEDVLSYPGHNFEYVIEILNDETTGQFVVSIPTAAGMMAPLNYWLICYSAALTGFSSGGGLSPGADCIAGISPNPFKLSTEICFLTGESGQVEIAIYDLSGHLVRGLHRGFLPAGETRMNWDCCNQSGEEVQPGVYFCSLTRAGSVVSRKLVFTGR